jgi:glycine cleavage system T protein (aminomethyltransferase)
LREFRPSKATVRRPPKRPTGVRGWAGGPRDHLEQRLQRGRAEPAPQVPQRDRIAGFDGPPLIVSRAGCTGERGYELWCHPHDAAALLEAGSACDLAPLGLDALDLLRIEFGLIFAGDEFCDQVDPFEAGIGFTVPLKTREVDFVDREALLRRKADPSAPWSAWNWTATGTAGHGDCVHLGRCQVGVISSGMRSPILRESIALCRMTIEYSEIGTEVEVGKLDGQGKRITGPVARFPFYDPDKTRPCC